MPRVLIQGWSETPHSCLESSAAVNLGPVLESDWDSVSSSVKWGRGGGVEPSEVPVALTSADDNGANRASAVVTPGLFCPPSYEQADTTPTDAN